MIKFTNYNQATKDIDWSKYPEVLHKTHKELIPLAQEGAYADADVKRVVDSYIVKLNAAISKQQPTSKAPEQPAKKQTTPTKPKKEAKQRKATLVERLDDEITLIKRYVNFHGKRITREQLTNLLKALQKAVFERRVNKKSKYGKEVMEIQNSLLGATKYKAAIFDIEIEEKKLERYTGIVTGIAPMASISLLKRFIGLVGKKGIKDKVKRLQSDFQRAFDKDIVTRQDKYYTQFDHAFEAMKAYVNGKTEVLEIAKAELNGFKGLGFIPAIIAAAAGATVQVFAHHHLSKKKDPLSGPETEVMSVSDAKNEKFKEIGLTGDYLKLIGRACAPFSLFIYGNGGSGKSGLALKLADDLFQLNNSVLYAAGEQFGTPTFTELLRKINISGGENFKIVKSLTTLPIEDFDVIVIDSKERANLHKSSDFKLLRDAYPDKNFILTSQGLKSGGYKGDGQWLNEVDTFVYCQDGKATTIGEKNRWGASAEITLF